MRLHVAGRPGVRVPMGVGNLSSLQDLELQSGSIKSKEDFAMEVGKLMELRILKICVYYKIDEGTKKALLESLCGLRRLQNLVIKFDRNTTRIWEGWDHWEPPLRLREFHIFHTDLPRLPAWVYSMCVPYLSKLQLDVLAMEARDLDMLSMMPALRTLILRTQQRISWTVGGSMPMLVELRLGLWASEDGAASDVGLGHLPLLNHIMVLLYCEGAMARQVEEVDAVWRRMGNAHPNCPAIAVYRFGELLMKRDDDQDDEEISTKDHVDENGDDENSARTKSRTMIQPKKRMRRRRRLRTNLEPALCTHPVMLSGESTMR
uniref:Disease resistance R13L4/SHOC-2-like LRR domain-containing protein n=1 Tax=Oryza nivara TaxID=4536 RepID=A0A0E0J3R3_ORYNI